MAPRRGSVHRRPNGRWYVATHYRDSTGRKRQRSHGGFATKREAEQRLTEVLRQLDTATYVDPQRLDVASYLKETWLPAVEHQLKATTLASYRRTLELHVIPHVGAIRLQRLAPTDLDRLYGHLLREGRRNGAGGGLSPRTVRYVHTILRKALADALRKRLLLRNPADAADPPRQRQATQARFWTVGDIKAFLAHVDQDRLTALWRLATYTGMRRGELVALCWSEVDLQNLIVDVQRSATCVGYEVVVGEPKSARSHRRIDLDAGTAAALRTHRARQAEEKLAWGAAYQDADLVFAKEDGTMLHPDWVSKTFRRLVASSPAPDIRFHDLRHTHVAVLAMSETPVKVISERVGHASVAFTLDQYGHVLPGAQAEAARRFADAVGDSS